MNTIGKSAKSSKMDFSFFKTAFTIILRNNELKVGLTDNKNYLYALNDSYYVCFLCTEQTFSYSSHTHDIKLYSKTFTYKLLFNKLARQSRLRKTEPV